MSDTVVHRVYWDFEKEERWLNAMAAKGLNLVRHSLGSYHFEQTEPGTWIYRIELLPGSPTSATGHEYLSLLRDAGVEVVGTHSSWAYLRRKASMGSFELFSDLESRIGYYRRVLNVLRGSLAILAVTAASLLVVAGESGGLVLIVPLAVSATAAVILGIRATNVSHRLRSLTSQRQVFE